MSEPRTALVTGASRGIGQAIAWELARRGCRVIGTATSEAGAERIRTAAAANALAVEGAVLNVTDRPALNAFLDQLRDTAGEPSILVNNAGITRDNLLLRMKDEDWDTVIETNLTAVFRLSRACLRGMMKARWGRIVNIGSVVGLMGNPGQANYGAAKAGVIGFSRALAREVASRGITVNTVAPGFIATDMTNKLSEAQQEAILSQVPAGRLGSPADIAHAVAFLASEQAGYITGELINVNGGLYA
ncbi:MAG TPA: 3-oxoacyl-ACP reductase FabG [Gammaproteobacteria bacterium]|nr:3-oxoacyl-ACP reductase FabG [Gammaproteobacteria bacterium]